MWPKSIPLCIYPFHFPQYAQSKKIPDKYFAVPCGLLLSLHTVFLNLKMELLLCKQDIMQKDSKYI